MHVSTGFSILRRAVSYFKIKIKSIYFFVCIYSTGLKPWLGSEGFQKQFWHLSPWKVKYR